MSRRVRLSITVLLVLIAIMSFGVAQVPAATTVAVVRLENRSGLNLPDVELAAEDLLSALLAESPGFRVVERDRLAAVMEEQGLVASGLVEAESTAAQLGRLVGADWLVTGSLLSVQTTKTTFAGYGLSSQQTVVRLSGTIRAVDSTSGEIAHADVITAQTTTLSTSYLTEHTSSIERALLIEWATKAAESLASAALKESGRESLPSVTVVFESTPEGSDVEIDGLYVGSTPLEMALTEGVHTVTISRSGYEPWEERIRAYEGLRVSVVLAPVKVQED